MKKILFFVLGVLILTGTAFADQIQGPVQSVNGAKNEIVVKDSFTGTNKVVIVHPKIVSTLQPGSIVKVSLKPGSNTADTLEVKIG